MIVVDANVFVRYLVGTVISPDEPLVAAARSLFAAVTADQAVFTTNEAVIAEVVFILHSRRHYGFPRREVADRFGPILADPGCRLPNKQRILDALDLWADQRRLSFVDALTALQALEMNRPLATFDQSLASLPGIVRWPEGGQ